MSFYSFLNNPLVNIWITIIFCSVILLLFVIKRLFAKTNQTKQKPKVHQKVKNISQPKDSKGKELQTSKASKKKSSENRHRADKQNFSHNWLLTSFKGHTSEVLDIDFSSNGKYLASCSEDTPDPGGPVSSCSESLTKDPPVDKVLSKTSRRQRKNRRRKSDDSSSNSSPELRKKKMIKAVYHREDPTNVPMEFYPPLRNFIKLNLSDKHLYSYLEKFVLTSEHLLKLGFPIESTNLPGHAMIFKNNTVNMFASRHYVKPKFDVNAREFVPGFVSKQWHSGSEEDSGQGSGTSSPVSLESVSSDETSDRGSSENLSSVDDTYLDRICVRCRRNFYVRANGVYVKKESCCHHWGKLHRVRVVRGIEVSEYTCCRAGPNSVGCTITSFHVWNGITNGLNGPLAGYVKTQPRYNSDQDDQGIFAIDCEMSFTANGLELTKVTVVSTEGSVIYDYFVRPDSEILDYNTRFSGITAKDLSRKHNNVKTLREVQSDLLCFINADSILIGHGLENDLRALKIIHDRVVDTSVAFPHYYGLPYKRSLKSLTSSILKRDIQNAGILGHNSIEDARSCMELMLWKVRKDNRVELQKRHQES